MRRNHRVCLLNNICTHRHIDRQCHKDWDQLTHNCKKRKKNIRHVTLLLLLLFHEKKTHTHSIQPKDKRIKCWCDNEHFARNGWLFFLFNRWSRDEKRNLTTEFIVSNFVCDAYSNCENFDIYKICVCECFLLLFSSKFGQCD